MAAKAKAKAVEQEADAYDDKPDYDALANRTWGSIPEEKIAEFPEGTWKVKLRGGAYYDATETASPRCAIFATPVEPIDVDEEALAALGDYEFDANSATYSKWLGETRDLNALFREVFAKVGFDRSDLADKELKESLKLLKGKVLAAYIKYDSYEGKDGATHEGLKITAFDALD